MKKGDEKAFPSNNVVDGNHKLVLGLTKREYFAAKAMQSYMAVMDKEGAPIIEHIIAIHSVKMADALLKELEK